jgi:microcystin-dependent protein
MAQPYVGEIRMFGGNFAPAGWMFCEGQLLPISENETLFQLIGTTYGGDGESTFALPDLRGRIPLHQGNAYILAETGGAEEVTLTTARCQRTVTRCLRRTPSRLNAPATTFSGRRRRSSIGADPQHNTPRERHSAGGRLAASHELPAVPVRRFHHLAVRDLPERYLGDGRG